MNKQDTPDQAPIHIPVLLQEVLEHLALKEGDIVFDGTYGAGGYSKAIQEHIGKTGHIYATDQDEKVIEREDKKNNAHISLFHANFSEIEHTTDATFDACVLDLGISSDQLSDENRGISFKYPEAPLDMRMNASQENHLNAWGILHSWEEDEIADALYKYGGERHSRKIARAIIARRRDNKLETSGDLVEAIESVVRRSGPLHPATKTFQALRIIVNNELGNLERFLESVPRITNPGARVVIVSFHSLEERIVKHAFRSFAQNKLGVLGTKKSLSPSRQELQMNPRSRSARLRSFIFN